VAKDHAIVATLAMLAYNRNALIPEDFLSGSIALSLYGLANLAMSVRMRIAGY
jgi:hypothetical protein